MKLRVGVRRGHLVAEEAFAAAGAWAAASIEEGEARFFRAEDGGSILLRLASVCACVCEKRSCITETTMEAQAGVYHSGTWI